MTGHSRRSFLRAATLGGWTLGGYALGGGVLGAAVSGCADPAMIRDARDLLGAERFLVAHRGAGDEAPEHTLAAYRSAVEHGAEAVEISVHRTVDGVLVCHHDDTLERTCAGTPGRIAELTAAQLGQVRVDMRPWVGPGWEPAPIPTLDQVLERLGRRAVLFVEPKDPSATDALLGAVADRGLRDHVVLKQHHGATGDAAARRAGVAVWNYVDDSATEDDIARLADRSDAIGVRADTVPLGAAQRSLVRAAVATGLPVVAWTVRHRHQLELLTELGVRGFMCSSWRYLARPSVSAAGDRFASGFAQPGDLPFDSSRDALPTWNDDGSIGLDNDRPQQSLLMGSLCPLGPAPYRISVDLAFDALPADPELHAGLAVDRVDDAPYAFRTPGPSGGLLVILRVSGKLELRRIPPDNGESTGITAVQGEPVVAGRWERLEVTVDGAGIGVRRTPEGGEPRTISAPLRVDGPYLALTRNFPGQLAGVRFRNVRVTSS